METVTREIARLAKPLALGAKVLEVVAIVGATVGVLVGVGLAGESEKVSGDTLEVATTHPWVGAGVAMVIGALIAGIFFWCLARALRIFAIDIAARHGESIVVEPLPRRPAGDTSALETGTGRRILVGFLAGAAAFIGLALWLSR